ncbi:MAG: hypothetical protein HQL13_01830 [Candidatus Omnitrophica bacterium]|nr:hypothetical protein [Candidatus Omnitrophota bacterium]
MNLKFEHKAAALPQVTFVLLDWSCRQSFHMLDYLNDQTIPRQNYEIIWIEYYQRRAWQIDHKLKEYKEKGRLPVVDKWLVLDCPQDVYYHKHLMYNVGIAVSRACIICFCDSDAVVKHSFVQRIIQSFAVNPNIVLHMDQIRNKSKKFYPFNYPSIEEIVADGCINFKEGKTTGLWDTQDILHTRNYGACMAARREDLINIGGADEHIDYLGHICGPYEMTFRLMNAGKKEIWLDDEFLYHTWHPGTDGQSNYLGPHDGLNMSTTALKVRETGRILPLVENPAIKLLRVDKKELPSNELLSEAMLGLKKNRWKIGPKDKVYGQCMSFVRKIINKLRKTITPVVFFLLDLLIEFELGLYIIWVTFKQIFYKGTGGGQNKTMQRPFLFKLGMVFVFIWRVWKNNRYALDVCREVMADFKKKGIGCVAFWGQNDLTKVLCLLARKDRIKVGNIFDSQKTTEQDFYGYNGTIVVASFQQVRAHWFKLIKLGVPKDSIIILT